MTLDELRQKTEDQLLEEFTKAKKELFNLRFQKSAGELTNTSRFKVVKRRIAQILTIQAERQKNTKVGGKRA